MKKKFLIESLNWINEEMGFKKGKKKLDTNSDILSFLVNSFTLNKKEIIEVIDDSFDGESFSGIVVLENKIIVVTEEIRHVEYTELIDTDIDDQTLNILFKEGIIKYSCKTLKKESIKLFLNLCQMEIEENQKGKMNFNELLIKTLVTESYLQNIKKEEIFNEKKDIEKLETSHIEVKTSFYECYTDCIDNCFEGFDFKYINKNNIPKLIEVPNGLYEDAVEYLNELFEIEPDYKIKGIEKAEDLIIESNIGYTQAVSIAKTGVIENLFYDVDKKELINNYEFGLFIVIPLASKFWNTSNPNKEIKKELKNKVSYKDTKLKNEIYKAPIDYFKLNKNIISRKFEEIRSIDFITEDVQSDFDNNFDTGAVVVTTGLGLFGGAKVGAALGSFIPVVGTAIGAVGGAIAGAALGNTLAEEVIGDFDIGNKKEELLELVEKTFISLCNNYILSEEEMINVVDAISEGISQKFLREIYYADEETVEIAKRLKYYINIIVQERTSIMVKNKTIQRYVCL